MGDSPLYNRRVKNCKAVNPPKIANGDSASSVFRLPWEMLPLSANGRPSCVSKRSELIAEIADDIRCRSHK